MAMKIIKPEDWSSTLTGSYSLKLGSELFGLQSASKPWTISVPETDVIRFELRDGDQHFWDVQNGHRSERAELADRATISHGTPLNISYDFTLEPGARNTADWMVLGQLHQDHAAGQKPWSPPFAIALSGERLMVDIRYDGPNGPVLKHVFTDVADIVRGHKYDMDIKAVFDPYGNGRLVVTIDGVTVVDYSGPLGYASHKGVYWAQGIYRDSAATETVSATYGHLDIDTGSDVTFPDRDDFIAAPEVTVGTIQHLADDDLLVTVTGEAKAGTIVKISEKGVLLGTATVDANGRFSLKVKLDGDESHNLNAVAFEGGRKGLTAVPMTVEIITAADFVARMKMLAANPGLAAVVLTDTQVLTVSGSQRGALLDRPDLLDKIEGQFTFLTTATVTGKPYNRQDEIFSSDGALMERLRYQNGRLVYEEEIGANGMKTVTNWKTDGSRDVLTVDNGRTTGFSQYNAANVLVLKQINNADGSKEADYFNGTTGRQTSSLDTYADGGRKSTTYGITGKAYVTESATFDKNGKQVLHERFDGNGTALYSRSWTADGSVETHNYNAAGQETSFSLVKADGSRVDGLFGIAGQFYSGRIITYDKAGVMIKKELLDSAGNTISIETFGANATLKVLSYDASFDLTGYTLHAADKSYVVVTFFSGSDTQIARKSIYDKDGALVDTLLYDTSGNLLANLVTGGTKTYTVNTKGVATGSTTTAADGSYVVTKFTPGREDLPISATKYTAAGVLYEIDSFNTRGQLTKIELRNADGSRETHNYDPLTQAERSYTIIYADKSREDGNFAITGKSYAQQFAKYDSNGKLVEMTRKYGDADHTLAFTQKNNADGSSEVHQYDTRGRETSAVLKAADGSSDAYFYYYTGAATSISTATHVHYDKNKVLQWADGTKADGSHVQTSYAGGAELTSHAGVADLLNGSAKGSDTFIFLEGFGKDTIKGFQAGSARISDTIEFDTSVVSSFAELLTMMKKQGSDTIITIDSNDVLVLKGVNPATLTAADFRFVDHDWLI